MHFHGFGHDGFFILVLVIAIVVIVAIRDRS